MSSQGRRKSGAFELSRVAFLEFSHQDCHEHSKNVSPSSTRKSPVSSYFGVILDEVDFAQSARRARRKSPRRAQRIARPVQRAHGTGNARANFRFPRALHWGSQRGLGPQTWTPDPFRSQGADDWSSERFRCPPHLSGAPTRISCAGLGTSGCSILASRLRSRRWIFGSLRGCRCCRRRTRGRVCGAASELSAV